MLDSVSLGGQIAAVVATAGFVRFLWAYYEYWTSPLWKLPGPPRKSFFVGHMFEILGKPVLGAQQKWWKEAAAGEGGGDGKADDVDCVHNSGLLGGHTLCLLNADLVKRILTARAHRDPKFPKAFPGLRRTLGDGLVTLEGEDWHRHRRIIHPSFQLAFLKKQLSARVPTKVSNLIRCWKEVGGNHEIELSSHLSLITLDVIGEVAFSHEFHGMNVLAEWAKKNSRNSSSSSSTTTTALGKEDGGDTKKKKEEDNETLQASDEFMQAFNKTTQNSFWTILTFMLKLDFLDFEGNEKVRVLNKAVDRVVSNARTNVTTRAAASTEENVNGVEKSKKVEESKYTAKSVLELLFHARDTTEDTSSKKPKTLADVELRDEVKTFLVAGHETTSSWCYWAIYALSQYPDVQQKVYEDVCRHAPPPPKNNNNNETMIDSLDDIDKMTYLEAFLKECLRFYSPVALLMRKSMYEETFKGTVVPAGTKFIIPIYLLHRHEKYWSQPSEFQPERWLGKDPPYSHPYAYLPFSMGPRNCVGYKFAEIEARLIMTNLVRTFTFRLAPSLRGTEFKVVTGITTKLDPQLKICAQARD